MKRLTLLLTLLSTLAFGAAPSNSSDLTVTTTSAAYYVPFGYIALTCTSPPYYAMETVSPGVALTTDALHPGPLVINANAVQSTVGVLAEQTEKDRAAFEAKWAGR